MIFNFFIIMIRFNILFNKNEKILKIRTIGRNITIQLLKVTEIDENNYYRNRK